MKAMSNNYFNENKYKPRTSLFSIFLTFCVFLTLCLHRVSFLKTTNAFLIRCATHDSTASIFFRRFSIGWTSMTF